MGASLLIIMDLTTRDAIEQRRSIRKFKSDPVPDEHVMALIEAARLAPSGSNAQPWRFKVVRDEETKVRLMERRVRPEVHLQPLRWCWYAARTSKDTLAARFQARRNWEEAGAIEDRIAKVLVDRAEMLRTEKAEEIGPRVASNVSIAIEHIVLRALDFGLGTCWVRMIDGPKIKKIFGWGDNIFVVALLPIGYPDESPLPRKRLAIEDILL